MLDAAILNRVHDEFRSWFMFDLVVNGQMIVGLADFDEVVKQIAKLDVGTKARIDLRDWVDEDEFLGSVLLERRSAPGLFLTFEDVPNEHHERIQRCLALCFEQVDPF